MSSAKALEIQTRDNAGTGAARAVRRQGFIPCVLYGNKETPVNLSIERRLIDKELKESGILTRLFNIKVNGADQPVLIRQIQFHPVTDAPIHIDFMRVSKSGKITVDVAVHVINEDKCPGLKKGGAVNIPHHTLPISCPADAIPSAIEIDLEGIEMGHSIHLGDIKLPAGVEVLHAERYETLVTIIAHKEEKVATEAEAEPAAEPKA